MPQRVVPTLTEVLDASAWQTTVEALVVAEPAPLDEEMLRAVTNAVDAAVGATIQAAINDLRAELRPRIEAAVRQAMAGRPLVIGCGE